MPDKPKPRACAGPRRRGGRRPGAGAPKGNLNALKSGRYSKRLKALQLALTAMPRTTDTLVQLTGRDRKKAELLALALQHYAEILLLIARGQAVPGPDQSTGFDEPQLLRRAIHAISIKQSDRPKSRSSKEQP